MTYYLLLFFGLTLAVANIVLLISMCIDKKRRMDYLNLLEAIQTSNNIIAALDSFRKEIPQMSEEFVSEITPVIDSYIKERIEAYIKSDSL